VWQNCTGRSFLDNNIPCTPTWSLCPSCESDPEPVSWWTIAKFSVYTSCLCQELYIPCPGKNRYTLFRHHSTLVSPPRGPLPMRVASKGSTSEDDLPLWLCVITGVSYLSSSHQQPFQRRPVNITSILLGAPDKCILPDHGIEVYIIFICMPTHQAINYHQQHLWSSHPLDRPNTLSSSGSDARRRRTPAHLLGLCGCTRLFQHVPGRLFESAKFPSQPEIKHSMKCPSLYS